MNTPDFCILTFYHKTFINWLMSSTKYPEILQDNI